MILIVVVIVRVELAVAPAERSTLMGVRFQQNVEHGTSGVDRLIVPLNLLTLVRTIIDVAVASGCKV